MVICDLLATSTKITKIKSKEMNVQNETEIKNRIIPLFQNISTYKKKKNYIDGGMLRASQKPSERSPKLKQFEQQQ